MLWAEVNRSTAMIVCFLLWHLTDVRSWNARMSEEKKKRNGTCMLQGFRGNLAKIVVHGHPEKVIHMQ